MIVVSIRYKWNDDSFAAEATGNTLPVPNGSQLRLLNGILSMKHTRESPIPDK